MKETRMRCRPALIAFPALLACSCGAGGAARLPDGGASDTGTLPDIMFIGPDATVTEGGSYVPKPGTCGFDAPAFCETFEDGPANGGRSGELDPTRFSAARGMPSLHSSLGATYPIGPALLPECRPGLSGTAVMPDRDAVICDPTASVSTRHLLATAAAQNYGMTSYRIRQPFDFAGRTGVIKMDVDLSNNALGGWPAIAISEDPTPMPTFEFPERGSGPRNGFLVEFETGWCNTPNTVQPLFFGYRDYVETTVPVSYDCGIPHVKSMRDALNHVEIYLTQTHLEVWASDASPDGVTFPNFQRLYTAELALPFSRAYVNLVIRNHATIKYWVGSAWQVRWDNVGFDGPVVTGTREFSAPDSLVPYQPLPGCLINGKCEWIGGLIPGYPGTVCGDAATQHCEFPGEGMNVGYVVPNSGETPLAIEIPGVALAGATRARLALAADYPWFEWNNFFPPPTTMDLQFRLNGGAWHDRFVSDIEAKAFAGDFSTGGSPGAGLLNQIIALDPAELRDGTNRIELLGAHLWTGSYRIAVTAIDLLLDTP